MKSDSKISAKVSSGLVPTPHEWFNDLSTVRHFDHPSEPLSTILHAISSKVENTGWQAVQISQKRPRWRPEVLLFRKSRVCTRSYYRQYHEAYLLIEYLKLNITTRQAFSRLYRDNSKLAYLFVTYIGNHPQDHSDQSNFCMWIWSQAKTLAPALLGLDRGLLRQVKKTLHFL